MSKLNSTIASIIILVLICGGSVYGQVTADFSANNTQGCGSLQVAFTDLSSSTVGAITTWSWDFGNATSTIQNPGRIYGTPGTYTVCLTVTDSEGNSDTECKTDLVQVFNLPQPDFVADPPVGCSPFSTSFIDQSTSQDGAITQWIWGVGGSTGVVVSDGTAGQITSTYDNPDNYTVSLTITDDNGCINTITKENYIQVSSPPNISFSTPTTFSCTAPFIVDFQNDSNTQDMEFTWNFGNGITFVGNDPPATVYTDFGEYTPCLIGTNTITGCSDTLCLTDYIQVGHPIDFSYSTQNGCEDLTVSFTDNSIDPATTVIWDFGNGDSSAVANPSYTYTTPGCYTVTLTRIVNGCIAFVSTDNCIEVYEEPTVNYTNDNPIGCTVPHTVQFFGFSNNGLSYQWDFGDGQVSDLQNPVHTYTSEGNFQVTLTVTNDNDCSSTINTDFILIQPIQALIPQDTMEGCTPLDVTLSSISTSPTPITNWYWEVTNYNSTPAYQQNSIMEVPDFSLVDTGYYEIKLIVTNSIGCQDTAAWDELIAVGIPPEMGFDADPQESCVESPVTFVGQTSDFTNDWLWDFGDGSFGYGETPEHEFVDTGYFDVTLFAYHHSCENQLTIDSFIHVLPPIAGFNVTQFCETPFYIELVDQAIGADSVFWDFGIDDPNIIDTSSLTEPSFTYPFTGDFTITQTVFNFVTQCSHEQTFFIQIRDLTAEFTVDTPLDGCIPMTINFTNTSQDAISWNWSAPGGTFDSPSSENTFLVYFDAGTYTDIQLITSDVNNCLDTMVFTQDIRANGITTDFTLDPTDGCRPLTVSFNDLSSSLYGNIAFWTWDYNGGAPINTEQNPTVVFENIGTYDVRLNVTDDWGCNGTFRIQDAVDVTYPLVAFSADTLSCTSRNVQFNNATQGKGLSYLWDFGDGQTSTATNPSHLYTSEGVYDVCLTATDVNGCDSTLCFTDYIIIADPVASFDADTTFASCPPLIVNFENSSQHSTEYSWDFGDGSGASNLESPPHVYTQPGVYDVTLIASFDGACHDTLVIDDYISVDGPVGSFTFDIDSACIPATITFFGESIDVYDYTWDFGNGDLDTTNNIMNDTVQYVYDQVGSIIPQLILEDVNGCRRAFESPDTIYLEQLTLDFLPTDSILCTGEDNTTFINWSFSSLPINSVEWILDGGNPQTSDQFEPNVTYDSAGLFDVIMIMSNGFCTDTLVDVAAIKVGETPVAAFSMSDSIGCPPFPIGFTDLSSVGMGSIVGWDWDYGDGDTGSFQNPTHVFDSVGVFDVNLTVTTDIGCTDEVSNTLETFPMPIVEAPEPYNMCIGNTAQLEVTIVSDSTNLTYYWLDDPTLSCTDCFSPIANPVDTTIYYFVINNEIGCSDTTPVVVEVRPFPAPVVTITEDTMICANSLIQITATGGANIFEYQWDQSVPGLSCYENCFNPIATPAVSSTYTVTVTNEFDCFTVEDVFIEVLDEGIEFAGPDRTICRGSSTQLDVSMGSDPVWIVSEGLDCTYCPNPTASPDTTTTYYVRIVTDNGCEITDTITINVIDEEDFDAGDNAVICIGEEVQLNGFGDGEIVWSPDNTLSADNIINPVAFPNETTLYELTLTNDECTMVDSVLIEVVSTAEVFAESQIICEGESVELIASGSIESVSWTPGETLSDVTSFNPIASPTQTTTYVVTGSLGTCQDDTTHVTVTVVPGPETRLTRVYDFFAGQSVDLEIETEELAAFSYAWSPIELVSCVSCPNPQVTVDSTTNFTVTVTDPNTGCWTVDTTQVRLQNTCPPDLIGVPNIFTPNNDGLNDELRLFLSPALQPSGIEMLRIYDRWGALVYETDDANDSWDGTFKGKNLPAGVYVYYVKANCPLTNEKFVKKGDITLYK